MSSPTPLQAIGRNMRLARKFSGVSFDQLCDETGLTRQTLSGHERGRSAPSSKTLLAWSKLTGFTVDALLLEDHTCWKWVNIATERIKTAAVAAQAVQNLMKMAEREMDYLDD